jgi:hypothetical protein
MIVARSRNLALLLPLAGCVDMSALPEGICGNEVLEFDEDCDVHVDTSLGEQTACGDRASNAPCSYVCTAEARCPRGWDCGKGGVCRRAGPTLVPGASAPDWAPVSFAPVDFDGDGRVDLVGAFGDRIEVMRSDASGAFIDAFVTPTLPVTGDVAVGRLDSDAFGDIVLPTELGFSVWRGQAEGPPQQVAYASYDSRGADKLIILKVRYPPLDDRNVNFIFYEDIDVLGPALGACINTDAGLSGCHMVDALHRLDDIGERIALADFDLNGSDEIAIGFAAASTVKIFGMRQDVLSGTHEPGNIDGSSPLPLEIDVSAPRLCEHCTERATALTIDLGAHTADADGDGDSDLVVSVKGLTSKIAGVVVVRGDGAGHFADPYLDTRFKLLASQSTVVDGFPGLLQAWPIAAGDLDGDDIADYVSPNGIFLARPDAMEQVAWRDTLYPWTAARVTDIDGDDDSDVVAISAGQPRVDVLRSENGGSTFVRRAPYVTKLGVSGLRAGSLQGLAATDIVLVERAPAGSPADDALSVMFGQPLDWPTEPVRQAGFHAIEHMELGDFRYPGWPVPNGFDDVVLSTRTTDGELAVGVLFANGTQALSSPYFAESANARAEHALSGRFGNGENEYDDLLLFGSLAGPRAWWVPGAEDAAFAPTPTGQELGSGFDDPSLYFDCVRFSVGDVEGDGRDEAVGLWGEAVCAGAVPTRLALGHVSSSGRLRFEAQPFTLADGPSGARIALADVDGDGSDDLVVARSGRVEIAPGGPSGLGPAALWAALPLGEQVLDVVAVARSPSATGPGRFAVLTDSSVLVLSTEGTAQHAMTDARAMRSADVDGDGLGDILVLADTGTYVLLTAAAPRLGGTP